MKQMIKRKDGSYSQKGLWDNIRANKGSGKKPTKEMLKQEDKIEEMNSKSTSKKMGGGYKTPKYQMGGDMIEPSKEINFDRPMMRKGGEKPAKSQRIEERAKKKMTKAKQSWTKAEQARKDSESAKDVNSPLGAPTGNLERYANAMYRKAGRQESKAGELMKKSEQRKEVEDVGKSRAVKKKVVKAQGGLDFGMDEETQTRLGGKKVGEGDGVANCVSCQSNKSNAPRVRTPGNRRRSLNNFATKSRYGRKVVKSNTPKRQLIVDPNYTGNPTTMASMYVPKYPEIANIGLKIPKR